MSLSDYRVIYYSMLRPDSLYSKQESHRINSYTLAMSFFDFHYLWNFLETYASHKIQMEVSPFEKTNDPRRRRNAYGRDITNDG